MIVVCCRCHTGSELDDELFEHDGEGDMPLVEPVPRGWLPDPDSDHGSIHPGCPDDPGAAPSGQGPPAGQAAPVRRVRYLNVGRLTGLSCPTTRRDARAGTCLAAASRTDGQALGMAYADAAHLHGPLPRIATVRLSSLTKKGSATGTSSPGWIPSICPAAAASIAARTALPNSASSSVCRRPSIPASFVALFNRTKTGLATRGPPVGVGFRRPGPPWGAAARRARAAALAAGRAAGRAPRRLARCRRGSGSAVAGCPAAAGSRPLALPGPSRLALAPPGGRPAGAPRLALSSRARSGARGASAGRPARLAGRSCSAPLRSTSRRRAARAAARRPRWPAGRRRASRRLPAGACAGARSSRPFAVVGVPPALARGASRRPVAGGRPPGVAPPRSASGGRRRIAAAARPPPAASYQHSPPSRPRQAHVPPRRSRSHRHARRAAAAAARSRPRGGAAAAQTGAQCQRRVERSPPRTHKCL